MSTVHVVDTIAFTSDDIDTSRTMSPCFVTERTYVNTRCLPNAYVFVLHAF